MYLLARFFFFSDVLMVPLCLLVLYGIIRARANRQKSSQVREIYLKAFWFKTFFVFAFTLVTEYYFKGGDTGLYYQGVTDLRTALSDDPGLITEIFSHLTVTPASPLYPYFFYDNYADDITANYMLSASNYFIPRLALVPSLLFNNSYVCINLVFSFFALAGGLRLFKVFYHFFPAYWKEIALATLFLPDVCYWSGGLLKDPVCFGAVGFIVYGVFKISFLKQKVISSVITVLLAGYLLFHIKLYILLVLAIAIIIWQFSEFNKLIRDRTLRIGFSVLSFALAAGLAYGTVVYLTSQEGGQAYSLDRLLEQSANQRRQFGILAVQQGGSYFQVETENPVLMVLNGIVATFFRPFPWEVRSPIMLFSAVEALLFLILTLNFMFKKGVKKFFGAAFSDSRILFCFVFAIVFAVAVGTTTSNFGALSRYKIPCMPFYLLVILLLYRNEKLAYPGWFTKTLSFISR